MKMAVARIVAIVVLISIVVSVTATVIPYSYIIVFKPNTDPYVAKQHISNLTSVSGWSADDKVVHKYNIGSFSGYNAIIHSRQVLNQISVAPEVSYIENDLVETIACNIQPTPGSWGLARTSTDLYIPNGNYNYPAYAGSDVDAYIIDTGILITHKEFGGRARLGAHFVGTSAMDDNGHGTHCAGTVGGELYGIAKKCTLIAVKVLDSNGSGTKAITIAGIDWIYNNKSPVRRAVANLSLGGAFLQAQNDAVNNLVASGVVVAVAAGNSNDNACNYSPASASDAIGCGATTSSDIRSSFSNWGTCVHMMAPGSSITSAYIGSSNEVIATISGTSMATPHVCGVAAVFLGIYPTATPFEVRDWMVNRASKINLGDLKGSPDRLLHQGCY